MMLVKNLNYDMKSEHWPKIEHFGKMHRYMQFLTLASMVGQ